MNIRRVFGGNLVTGAAFQDIPNLKTQCTHGNGPLLLLITSTITNTGATDICRFQILRDGANVAGWGWELITALAADFFAHYLIAPAPGPHVWSGQAQTTSGGPYNLSAQQTSLSIIELPEWDETPLGIQ